MNINRSALMSGLVLIGLGVLFLLNNFGVFPPNVVTLWPVLVVAAGLWVVVSAMARRRGGAFVGGVALLTAGTFWLLENLGRVRPEAFGAVMLMAVGVGLLLRGFIRSA
jgi:lia operon protein LiaF